VSTNTYSLTISYNNAGQFSQNILHFQFDDSGFTDTASAALALCNAFDTANTTHLANLLPTATHIESYRARNVTAPGGFEALKLLSGVFGARTGNVGASAPSPVAVTFPTGNANPRGRCFLPGVTDTDMADGEFSAAYRTAFTTHSVLFKNTLTLTGGGAPVATPVIFSRKTTPGSSYTIEYVRLSDILGTQRRRQRPA
jgi:hypothetical protein